MWPVSARLRKANSLATFINRKCGLPLCNFASQTLNRRINLGSFSFAVSILRDWAVHTVFLAVSSVFLAVSSVFLAVNHHMDSSLAKFNPPFMEFSNSRTSRISLTTARRGESSNSRAQQWPSGAETHEVGVRYH